MGPEEKPEYPQYLTEALSNNAGKIIWVYPNQQRVFQSKAWNVDLIFNKEWAKEVMALGFDTLRRELKKRRYLEGDGWPKEIRLFYRKSQKRGLADYTFDSTRDSGLPMAIYCVGCEPPRDLVRHLEAQDLHYTGHNMDTFQIQEYALNKIRHYVGMVNGLLARH